LNEGITSFEMESQRKCRFSKRNHFTDLEDRIILDAVHRFGESNLVTIASFVPSRTPNQCKMRYLSNLSPTLNFAPFTEEEDEILKCLVGRFGTCWRTLSKYFNGRSETALKNRWNFFMTRKNSRIAK
jgi:hypothetical protein